MKATFALSRPAIAAGTTSKIDLLVSFKAEANAALRRPMNLSLVIDRSGSMAGDPLRHAVKAAQGLVDRLTPEDRLSIVIYDDTADAILKPDLVTDKAKIKTLLAKVYPGGCTNLSGGWLMGCGHVQSGQSREKVNRVLLLTDGQANTGVTDPKVLIKTAKEKADAGIITTTLGFGSGFNEDLLIGMATAAEGNFYFIQSPDDAAGVFAIEIEGLASVAAQNLTVVFRPAGDVKVAGTLNKFRTSSRDRETEVAVGDVYGVEGKQLALELSVPAGAAEGSLTLGTLAYTYQSVEDGSIREHTGELPIVVSVTDAAQAGSAAVDAAVIAQVSRLRIAKVKDEAIELADKGDLAGASKKLRAAIDDLRASPAAESFEIAEEIDQLDHYAQRFEKKKYDSVIRKEMRDQAYQAGARSRTDLSQRGTAGGSADTLEAVSDAGQGVVVKCEREGGKLRIRVVSDGYEKDLNVQFPRSLREEGVTYVVDSITKSTDGSFYRVGGSIRQLLLPGQVRAAPRSSGGSSAASKKAAKPAKTPATAADLQTVTSVGTGVLVQCVKEGSKLRARVVSDGYDPNWNIRFPRSIREEGVLYVVEEVVQAGSGESYIANGDIRKLVQQTT